MAVAQVVGVFDDGTPVAAGVPRPVKQIGWALGEQFTLELSVLYNSGLPFAFKAGDSLKFSVANRLDPMLAIPQLTKTVTPVVGLSTASFVVSGQDSKFLEAGRLVYDIWLTRSGARSQLVKPSYCVLGMAVGVP